MAIKPIHHYAIENPGSNSVYDEEALTALQLAGRTAHKVNEVIKHTETFTEDMTNKHNALVKSVPGLVASNVQEHIDGGAFDRQIDEYAGNLEARVDNLTASAGESNTEVVDVRVGADRTQYKTAGEAVRSQFRILAENSLEPGVVTMSEVVKGEYYHNDTGTISTDASGVFTRSRHLYPCGPGEIFTVVEGDFQDTHKVYISCYDRNMAFLGYIHPFGGNVSTFLVKCTPPNTAYIGISVGYTYTGTLRIKAIGTPSGHGIEYPFPNNQAEYIYKGKAFMNGTGVVTYDYDTYDVCVFKTQGIQSIYVNSTILYNALFFDCAGAIISNGSEFTVHGLGRSYEVPDNAVYVCINMPRSGVDDNGHTTSYIALTKTKGDGLNGKNVLCIGDSITWLDGRDVPAAGTNQLVGYQAELRKRGAIVDTIGISGVCFGIRTDENGDAVASLSAQLPDPAQYDHIDAVVLMCGSNDIGFQTDTDGVDQGIASVMSWVSNNCPYAVTYICTPIPRVGVAPSQVQPYYDILVNNAFLFGTPLIDAYHLYGNATYMYYDNVHPDRNGMKRLGRIVANEMERSI